MANIGGITVSLTTLTAKFTAGFKKANSVVDSFTTKVGAAASRMTAFATAGAAAAATALGYFTHRAMESIDTTAKVADRLGSTTEQLIGMRYAANLAGVGLEEFDKSQEKLSKNLANPNQETLDALQKIGLSSYALLALSPAERFAKIADGINNLGTQAEKASVATALFGKTGANLLNTLELGSKGLAEASTEAAKLGLMFSRIDASKVEEANDAMTKVGAAIGALFTKLSVEVSPFITEFSNKLISLGTDGGSVADVLVEGAVDIARSMLRIVDVVDLVQTAFEGLKGVFYSLAAAWSKTQYGVTKGLLKLADIATLGSTRLAMKGGIEGQFDLTPLLATAAERDAKAVQAFAASRESLAKAIDGERSGAAMQAFDRIRSEATARAAASVAASAAQRKAGAAAELKRNGEELGRGFVNFVSASSKFAQKVLDTGNGARLVNDAIAGISGFFKGLPARAIAAGFRPEILPETTVRGTFAAEIAGRQSPGLTIASKQLEQAKQQTALLESLNAQFGLGIPLP